MPELELAQSRVELSQAASEASGPEPSRHSVARQAAREGTREGRWVCRDKAGPHQPPTSRLCSPEMGELLPSLSWIHTSNWDVPPGREALTPVHCPGRQWLTGIQTGVRLCPFLAEEAGLDGRIAPTAELQGVPGAVPNFSPKINS